MGKLLHQQRKTFVPKVIDTVDTIATWFMISTELARKVLELLKVVVKTYV